MSDLFEMLTTITRRRKSEGGSPFASVKATERWLKNLHADSDYDAHHALVEGLERFNAENVAASLGRMKSLMKLEEAGLPLAPAVAHHRTICTQPGCVPPGAAGAVARVMGVLVAAGRGLACDAEAGVP